MSNEINNAGYESIAEWLTSAEGWNWISLIDDADAEITRINIDTDARAEWITTTGEQTQILEVEVSGADSDIPIDGDGTTISASASFDVADGGDRLGEDVFPDALISVEEDNAVIEHRVEIPQV